MRHQDPILLKRIVYALSSLDAVYAVTVDRGHYNKDLADAHRFLAFHKPRRAGARRFLARASFGFGRNHMIYRPTSVEGGFTMISRHEGPDLGRPSTLITRFYLGNSI